MVKHLSPSPVEGPVSSIIYLCILKMDLFHFPVTDMVEDLVDWSRFPYLRRTDLVAMLIDVSLHHVDLGLMLYLI